MSLLQQYFLQFRELGPLLFESGTGWSFLALPAVEQPEWDADLRFLDELEGQESELPFCGGWVGYVSYDQGLEWAGVQSRHYCDVPKMWWKYCDRGVAVDPEGQLHWFGMEAVELGEVKLEDYDLKGYGPRLSYEEYAERIAAIHEKLRAGESYQVCFTQDFRGLFEGDAFAFYCALFDVNAAAMTFYAEDAGWAIASNSPERLFSKRGKLLRAEPIKGTVGAEEDPEFLRRDPKSYAELTMIVDLLRNDLGRVAKKGSVEVKEHQALMQLKNVWHTYSVIEAELEDGLGMGDVLRALFPGGSITGCPKLRTMQILDELEDYSRGAYCGSAGYVSANGNADFNIMIRTATVQGGELQFPAGGGIVMDSTPEGEWEECLKKVDLLLK